MRIFIEGMDFDIWESIKNGPFALISQVNGVVVNKEGYD